MQVRVMTKYTYDIADDIYEITYNIKPFCVEVGYTNCVTPNARKSIVK